MIFLITQLIIILCRFVLTVDVRSAMIDRRMFRMLTPSTVYIPTQLSSKYKKRGYPTHTLVIARSLYEEICYDNYVSYS